MSFFGVQHVTVLVVIGLLGFGLIWSQRRGGDWPRAVLAFVNLVVYAVNQAAYASLDYEVSLDNILPFHLCDVVAVVCGFALLTGNRVMCDLAYFWGLTGTLQGLITPSLAYDWDHPVFWTFFLQHGVVVVTAIFLPVAMGWRPDGRSFWRAFGWGQVYFWVAFGLNFLLGTNFGFLREKPFGASVLDYFGEWPWYLVGIQFFGVVAFLILLLPFLGSLRRRSNGVGEGRV